MSLPDILPTGAMTSGVYTDYMIGYDDLALDSISDQLEDYWIQTTMEDWNDKWTLILTDTGKDITTLNADVSKIKQKVRMIQDAINKL